MAVKICGEVFYVAIADVLFFSGQGLQRVIVPIPEGIFGLTRTLDLSKIPEQRGKYLTFLWEDCLGPSGTVPAPKAPPR
jgi:hypothetical protein